MQYREIDVVQARVEYCKDVAWWRHAVAKGRIAVIMRSSMDFCEVFIVPFWFCEGIPDYHLLQAISAFTSRFFVFFNRLCIFFNISAFIPKFVGVKIEPC